MHMRNLAAGKPDAQLRANRWLRYVEEGGVAPTKQLPSSFDLARIEKVVGQLEARSLALVKYRHAERPQPRRQVFNTTGDIFFVALWLSSFTLAVVFILTPPQSANQDGVASRRVISTVPNPEEQKLPRPVDRLAKALPSSSHGLKRFKAAVANAESPNAGPQDAATASIIAPTEAPSPAPTGVPQIQPSNLAVPHQAAGGTVDYWVMPRGPYDNSPTKVISVGKAPNGVVVLDLEDGKYYTVTPAAGWRTIPGSRSGN